MKNMVAGLIASALLLGAALAQEPSQAPARPRGEDAGQRGVMRMNGTAGTISAIEGDTLTLKTFDGKEAKVKVSDKTLYRKDRNEAKLADFKSGDMVFVRGEQNPDGSWAAQNVISRSDFGQFGGRGQGAGQGSGQAQGAGAVVATGNLQQMFEQGWGKQFIVGKVKSIDGTKLAIEGPMNHAATIEVDENTSFRKAGSSATAESITLLDIKPGANVFGCGAVNQQGTFVPTVLSVAGDNTGVVAGLAGCQNLRPPQK
jgi:hypothetical protein